MIDLHEFWQARVSGVELEQRQLAALARYAVMDAPAPAPFERFARLAAQGLGVQSGMLRFQDGQRVWSGGGAAAPGWTQAELALCQDAIRQEDGFVIQDAGPSLPFRFYAGIPVVTPQGHRIGMLCVRDATAGRRFAEAERGFLRDLAGAVITELEVRRLQREQIAASADTAFWNCLSSGIAGAPDFDAALDQALAYCAERMGAAICMLMALHPAAAQIEYVKSYFQPESGLAAAEMTPWFGRMPFNLFSFGSQLAQGQVADTGPLSPADDLRHYPRLEELVGAGLRRQIMHPFDLAAWRFGLVLGFERPDVPAGMHGLILEFITRLTPLLLGRQREDALARANRALRTIHASTEAFEQAKRPRALFAAACRLGVEVGGYQGAWIGLARQDQARRIQVVAHHGAGEAYTARLNLSWADVPIGQGPAGRALRDARMAVVHDVAREPSFAPWREQALANGFRAVIALPFGPPQTPPEAVFVLYSATPMAFGDEEQILLSELTANLGKALETIKTRRERDVAVIARSESETRLERLLQASGVVLYELAVTGEEVMPLGVSPNIQDMLGYAPADACSQDWWRSRIHPEDRPQLADGMRCVQEKGQCTLRYQIRHRDGSYRWIRDEMTLRRVGGAAHFRIVGAWIDITERRTAEEKIYQLAHLDPLTELPNRRLLNERLGEALAEMRRNGSQGALLFIDLDRFKVINDMLGHAAGDEVIREVAVRLKLVLRARDTVARVGGDEFVVLLTEAGATGEAAAQHAGIVARKIKDALASQPFMLGEREYHLGASIGFTIFPKPDDTLDALIREADTAMYQAKTGDAEVVMFQPAMYQSLMARHAVEDEIRGALKAGRFEIWLQDQVDEDGLAVSTEALIRLRGQDGRIISPAQFISVAESSGLIVPLGRWVLRESCSLLARVKAYRPLTRLAVNVSPRQFRDPAFVSHVLDAIESSGIAPDRLTLEITENLLVKDVLEIGAIMRSLAAHGVRFSVDDFGTGYSSLHYLQQLPIHEIKIDKGFVGQVPEDASSVAIVEVILAMGGRLGLDVVAEGVETPEQVSFLRRHGCARMQGYLFSRPIPAREWLEKIYGVSVG